MLRLLRKFRDGESPAVVDDQIGAPTSARMVASATAEIVKQITADEGTSDDSFGLFNVSAAGEASWYAFATEIASHYNRMFEQSSSQTQATVHSIKTSEAGTSARRPAYSVLSNEKVRSRFAVSLRHWKAELESVLDQSLVTNSENLDSSG